MITKNLVLAALLGASLPAAAIDVAIGNLSPATLEREPIAVFVDGERVERNLMYRRFMRVDLAEGRHTVSFIAPANILTNPPLVTREVTVTARNATTPVVVLAGNGATQPFSIEYYDGLTQPGTANQRPTATLHHLAPFERAETAERGLVAGFSCRNNARDGNTESRDIVYRGEVVFDPGAFARLVCSASFVAAGVGGIELGTLVLPSNGTLRAFLIGDAVNAPFEIVALTVTEVQALSGGGALNPSAIIRSPTFWFDPDRPTEGVNLFEATTSNETFGTWYTFAADGHPLWYALTGGVGTSFGRREFTVFEPRRGSAIMPLSLAGSAVLQYSDCNTAELRVVIGGSDLRTLRLKRSRPVEVCIALDRGD